MKHVLTAALLLSASALSAATPPPSAPAATAASSQPAATLPSANGRPPEERIALARQLISVVTPEDGGLQQMRDLSIQVASIPDKAESQSDREYAQEFTDRVLVEAAPIIRDHLLSIREVSAIVYASEFSTPELQQLIAFAQTPAGKHYFAREHFLDLDPAIVEQDMMLQDAIKPVIFNVRKEMCQEATAKRIAAGDKKAKCPLSGKPDTAAG